jgi:hypothetical protein
MNDSTDTREGGSSRMTASERIRSARMIAELIPALDHWDLAIRDYHEEAEVIAGFEVRDETLLADTRAFLDAILDAFPSSVDHPNWHRTYQLRRAVIDLTGRTLLGSISDSDTDAPCDVEYATHRLIQLNDSSYKIPEEVIGAYVISIHDDLNPPVDDDAS